MPPVQAALEELERAWRAAPVPHTDPTHIVETNARETQARAQTVRFSVDTLEHLMTAPVAVGIEERAELYGLIVDRIGDVLWLSRRVTR
jgi:hypothetical protein